jgi:hypothetical protein
VVGWAGCKHLKLCTFGIYTAKKAYLRYNLFHITFISHRPIHRFILSLVICLCSWVQVVAQQPAYFILGEEQFRGIQIYDVIEDKDLNYLFATNEGIYYYNHNSYEKLDCEPAKSNAFFNFIINDAGTIYCHNLNNQIFRIDGRQCKLFYELRAEEGTSDIGLSMADDGNLLISAKKIIAVNKNGVPMSQINLGKSYIGPPFTLKNGGVQFHYGSADSVCIYSSGKFRQYPLNHHPIGVLKFFNLNNQSYALNLYSKTLYTYNQERRQLTAFPQNNLFNREHPVRIYETGNHIWAAFSLPGVSFISGPAALANPPVCYPDYFISTVYKDHEGNILLGTFDKGVLVVPDVNVPDVIHPFKDDPVTAMYSHPVKGLMLGTSKGNLYHYINRTLTPITQQGSHPIEGIYGGPGARLVIFDDGHIQGYEYVTGGVHLMADYSLKDAAIISNNEFYLGTNLGIFKGIKNASGSYGLTLVKNLGQRIYSLEYNPQNACIYTSTASGLYLLDPAGQVEKIRLNQQDLFPNDLHYYQGKILASTRQNGILVIEDKKITGAICPIINGQMQELKKIYVHQHTLIGNTTHGLYQFNTRGELIRSIQSSSSNQRVFDFTFHQGQLWVSHGGGVQQINLQQATSNTPPPIRFHSIAVNDVPINFTLPGRLKSGQRKIQCIFSSPTLRNQQTIRYQYQLVGYDATWQTQHNNTHEITYNALAPGNYQLLIRAENQGTVSQPISWSFSIASPIYTRWWFITLGIVLFLGLVLVVYRWQFNIQGKKSKQLAELNASKLTAIQSQMNPHFIFNSLNSIQDLILKGDVEHSYSYITTFSNLVRRTLNYSEKDFIDFEQEIKLLELYLSLEKLRYKKDLNYHITTNQVADVMLPPLLIQPFIENALVHGLLHKEGEKNLRISFELKEVLICIIEDNGIGREQARLIQQRQRAGHESFSGKAIRQRFEILSHVFNNQFGYTYEDLYHNNQPAGTRVTLTIPIKRKF